WQRASQQAQLREQWAQTASQLGFGQAMDETRLREQLAQTAGAQNWQQALQEAQARAQQQQFGWQSGFQAQQAGQEAQRLYDVDAYQRVLAQNQLQYGRDVAERQAYNDLWQQQWNAQRLSQQQGWNQWASLAGLGQTGTSQLGTLGAVNAQQMSSLLGQ